MAQQELDNLEHDKQILEDIENCRAIIAEARRGIIKEFVGLEVFSQSEHSTEIKGMSRGMTVQEICDFYGISFNELPDEDLLFFCVMFIKGRVSGTAAAVDHLFGQMQARDGAKSSLAYLSRFGENWENIEGVAKGLNDTPKAIRIELVE